MEVNLKMLLPLFFIIIGSFNGLENDGATREWNTTSPCNNVLFNCRDRIIKNWMTKPLFHHQFPLYITVITLAIFKEKFTKSGLLKNSQVYIWPKEWDDLHISGCGLDTYSTSVRSSAAPSSSAAHPSWGLQSGMYRSRPSPVIRNEWTSF